MGQTCITLGKFHFTFWGLNRHHILRLFHWGKRLNYPQCSPSLHPHALGKLLSSTWPVYAFYWPLNFLWYSQITRNTWPAPSNQARSWCQVNFWKILSQCCIYLTNSIFLQAPPTSPQSSSLPCTARSTHLCFCSRSLCS